MPVEASAASGADSGALSVDSAVVLLSAPEEAPPREEPPAAAAAGIDAADDGGSSEASEIPAGDPAAEEADGAQPEEAAPEAGEEDGEVEPAATPAIEPPVSWDAEAKAVFAQLPAELQTKVAEIQAQRDRQTNEALQRAAEETRRAQGEAATMGQIRTHLAQLVPQAQKTFASRWDGIDWAAWAQQDPTAAYQGEQLMKAEQAQLQDLQRADQALQAQQYQAFLREEGQKLSTIAPELADTTEKGAKARSDLNRFLNEQGIPNQVVGQANAAMLAIAHDAMRFRELQAQAKQQLNKTRPTPPPAKPGLRPTPPPAGTSRTRQVDALSRRLSQTGKMDDAIALLAAQGDG